ncbi:MAG: AAA family ATPase [Rubrivivax sp.]|nr:AAA family ATPase [Rubrivivax sp.]
MYLDHFGLWEMPFGLTPDTGFTYRASAHSEALATLRVALRGGEGFNKITGEVGTGKTLLCRTLLATLAAEAEVVSAYLPNPKLTPRELLRALARELRLRNDRRLAETDLHGILEAGLLALAAQGRTVVLCIDEAQAMPPETLEALRLLSNLETEKRKLLQIVLFGQPELDAQLATPLGRALASRIGFAAQLAPLRRRELGHYLSHRMSVAGWRGPDAFTAPARWALWWASGGLPRKANILAHKCLLLAYGGGGHRVRLHHAWVALRDSEFEVHPSMTVPPRHRTAAGARAASATWAGAPT